MLICPGIWVELVSFFGIAGSKIVTLEGTSVPFGVSEVLLSVMVSDVVWVRVTEVV